jgi:hypothetical protein
MKFPKTRATVFVVVRGEGEALVGVFSDYEEAEDYRGACEQEWIDKTGHSYPFFVRSSTFYG